MSRADDAMQADFDGFGEHFKDVITPQLNALEDRRKRQNTISNYVFMALFYGVMPFGVYLFAKAALPEMAWPLVILRGAFLLSLGWIVSRLISNFFTRRVKLAAKETLMKGVAQHL